MQASFQDAVSQYQNNNLELASDSCRKMLTIQPKSTEALHLLGQIALDKNMTTESERYLKKALRLAPDGCDVSFTLAECLVAQDQHEKARKILLKALRARPDFFQAHTLLSQIELRGPHYHEVLAEIHLALNPSRYLEIGVSQGDSLRRVHPDTQALGIDPEPRVSFALPPTHRIVTATSDDFFSGSGLTEWLNNETLDLAFIDGMHQFEFALRDFINIEKHANSSAWILIHDCVPLDGPSSQAHRCTTFWSGDVWKLMIALKKYRPDLDVVSLPCPPTGLAVIRNLDPNSHALTDAYDQIIADVGSMTYEDICSNKTARLGIIGMARGRSMWTPA